MDYHTIINMSIVKFQSYQSKQNNPDMAIDQNAKRGLQRFNRINPNRTIPTATLAEPVVARLSDAEWRNLFLKD